MPVTVAEFEKLPEGNEEPVSKESVEEGEVLQFLREHTDLAFTPAEIAESTTIKEGTVASTLVLLQDRGRVDHRGKFWKISDHELTVDTATNHAAAVAESRENTGSQFDYDSWRKHAVTHEDLENER